MWLMDAERVSIKKKKIDIRIHSHHATTITPNEFEVVMKQSKFTK
jgi:hypothetical protein